MLRSISLVLLCAALWPAAAAAGGAGDATAAPSSQDAIRVCRDIAEIKSAAVLDALKRQYATGVIGDCLAARLKEVSPTAAADAPAEAVQVAPPPFAPFRDCTACPELISLPAGAFVLGTPPGEDGRTTYEPQQRPAEIAKPFAIGKFEVTFDEWDACVAGKGCVHRAADDGWGRGRLPVINVSWQDATDYAAWLSRTTGHSYRLPSEAEWEYAARAGTATAYATGPRITRSQANFAGFAQSDPSRGKTTEVGDFAANAFGLFDVHGNVAEWTADCYEVINAGLSDTGAPIAAPCSRTTRGGSFNDYNTDIRSGSRNGSAMDLRANTIGFRVVREMGE